MADKLPNTSKNTMADKCGNCGSAEQSQCEKKGDGYCIDIVEAEKSHLEVQEEEVAENDGKCKCGTDCSCTTCTCGH